MPTRSDFLQMYRLFLEQAVKDHPEEYAYSVESVPEVYEKMVAAFDRESYNKDSRAIKNTCKVMGVKHTYKAINAALRGDAQ